MSQRDKNNCLEANVQAKHNRRSRRRELLVSLIVLCGSLVFSAAVGELSVRVLFPEWAPRTARITKFWQYHPYYGWAHIPGTSGTFQAFGVDTQVSINEKGFRGPAVPYEKGEKERIIVLGDSFVWGYGVEYKDTFVSRLTGMFPNSEFVNMGVSGYSLDQELLLFREEGIQYRPDKVMLVVAANDIPLHVKTEAYLIYGKPVFVWDKSELKTENYPVHRTSWIKRTLVEAAWRSYLLTQLNRLRYSFHIKVPQPDSSAKRPKAFPRNKAEEITAHILRVFKEETESAGAKLLVVFVDGMGEAKLASEFLKREEIEYVALDDYVDYHNTQLHLPDGIHWSAAGHSKVADVLSHKLKDLNRNEVINRKINPPVMK
ncbi:MAG TPA: SGNH/GDSL hydrolase family protein [Bacteroidota bacterium]